jgi:4-hydroxybutyryl-CoA dehydratase/vinylacetyl-CoA-Delta-isomerase
MPSGTYLVDLLLANVCKQNVTRFPYEIARLAEDLAGGLLATMPSEKGLNHLEISPLVDKYLRGVAEISTPDRMRILRLIEGLTLGGAAVSYRTESMHGAGSPEAQVIMIRRLSDLDAKKALAKRLAGIGCQTQGEHAAQVESGPASSDERGLRQ